MVQKMTETKRVSTKSAQCSEISAKDATAVLKGMLGINIGGVTSGTNAPMPNVNGHDYSAGMFPNEVPVRTASRNKKKKDKKGPKQQKSSQRGNTDYQHEAKSSSMVPLNSPTGGKVRSKKHDKKVGRNNGMVAKSYNKKDSTSSSTSDGFAWSAFQSPPDASTLPLPMFGNHVNHITEKVVEGEEPPAQCSSKIGVASRTDTNESTTNVVEVIKNSSPDSIQPKFSPECSTVEDSAPKVNSVDNSKVIETAVSATGVNLAAFSSLSPTCENNSSSENVQAVDSVTALKLASIDRKLISPEESALHNQHFLVQQQQQQYINYMQQQQQLAMAGLPPGNPGFLQHQHQTISHQTQCITIQVRVPDTPLLPGRRIMIHDPTRQQHVKGAMISVTLPENAQPGMVIPVNIPIFPTQHHPFQHGPGTPMPQLASHNMQHKHQQELQMFGGNPYAAEQYRNIPREEHQHHYINQQQNIRQQQLHHSQYGQQKVNPTNSNGPKAGTWAAKVADNAIGQGEKS